LSPRCCKIIQCKLFLENLLKWSFFLVCSSRWCQLEISQFCMKIDWPILISFKALALLFWNQYRIKVRLMHSIKCNNKHTKGPRTFTRVSVALIKLIREDMRAANLPACLCSSNAPCLFDRISQCSWELARMEYFIVRVLSLPRSDKPACN
jgi:hypothetical protein